MIDALGTPQSVLLVGGTSEIGLAIVRRLAADRPLAKVVLAGRNAVALQAAAESIADCAATVTPVTLDLTDPAGFDPCLEQAFEGGIDVAVLAAGVLPGPDADPAEVAQVNYVGPMVLGTGIVERFRAQGRGVLVVMSTVAAERPRADNFLYGSTKAGLDAWANGLADALADTAIRILVVRPGMVRTRMSQHLPEAPMTTTADVVADAVAKNLVRGPVTVWVPSGLRVVMSGLRHLPRPVFRKVAATRGE